jgi:hypothetical protein
LCQKGSVEKRKEFGQLENVVWCQNRIVEKRKEFRQLKNVPAILRRGWKGVKGTP